MVVAVEIYEPKGFGRMRFRQIPDVNGNSLVGFVRQVGAPGSVVLIDGWKGYEGLEPHGYAHNKIVLPDSGNRYNSLNAALPKSIYAEN